MKEPGTIILQSELELSHDIQEEAEIGRYKVDNRSSKIAIRWEWLLPGLYTRACGEEGDDSRFTNKTIEFLRSICVAFQLPSVDLRDGTWSGDQELEWDEAHCGCTQPIHRIYSISRIEPPSTFRILIGSTCVTKVAPVIGDTIKRQQHEIDQATKSGLCRQQCGSRIADRRAQHRRLGFCSELCQTAYHSFLGTCCECQKTNVVRVRPSLYCRPCYEDHLRNAGPCHRCGQSVSNRNYLNECHR